MGKLAKRQTPDLLVFEENTPPEVTANVVGNDTIDTAE